MKDRVAKNIDELAGKVMKSSSLETPSFNFTDSVMSKVLALSANKVTVYKPLISKTAWAFIAIGFIATIIFVIFGTQTEPSDIDFSFLLNHKLTHAMANFNIPNFTITKTFAYAFVFFALMICVQIPILKHHFNQRYKF